MNQLEIKDRCTYNLRQFTTDALSSLPKLSSPCVLDAGCGTGIPSIAIAETIHCCRITAIDIDNNSIALFRKKITGKQYESMVDISCVDIFSIDYPEHSFDVILAEGLLNITGFKKGLSFLSSFLKRDGYFLIHDEFAGFDEKTYIIASEGYSIVSTRTIHEHEWKRLYVDCLESYIHKHEGGNKNSENLTELTNEIALYYRDPSLFRSMYYILQKG